MPQWQSPNSPEHADEGKLLEPSRVTELSPTSLNPFFARLNYQVQAQVDSKMQRLEKKFLMQIVLIQKCVNTGRSN